MEELEAHCFIARRLLMQLLHMVERLNHDVETFTCVTYDQTEF
jgi:hypothetical protein